MMSPKTIFKVLSLFFFCMVVSISPTSADPDQSERGPFAVFFALHMEAGRHDPDFAYQERNWPNLVQAIATADIYNAKLTLMFNPQWAEYILMDHQRLVSIKAWQRNGHEVALHYHLVTHHDWNGYTNRIDPIYVNSAYFRGTVREMMGLIAQLADPHPVRTACNGPDIATGLYPLNYPVAPSFIEETDFSGEIIYDVDGVKDGKTVPIHFDFNGRTRYHLRHGVAISAEDLESRVHEIESAHPDEVIGLVAHARSFDPVLIEQFFQDLAKKNIQIYAVSTIMDAYLQIN